MQEDATSRMDEEKCASNGSDSKNRSVSAESQNGDVHPMNGAASTKNSHAMELVMVKKWRACKIVVLCFLVVITWMLLLLPIVFYHLPVDVKVMCT